MKKLEYLAGARGCVDDRLRKRNEVPKPLEPEHGNSCEGNRYYLVIDLRIIRKIIF